MWRKLMSKIREAGLPYTLQLAIDRFIPKALLDVRVVWLCSLPLGGDALNPERRDSQIRRSGRDELEQLLQDHEVITGMREKLGPGVDLWLSGSGTDIDAFMWLDSQVIQPSHWIRFELGADEVAGVFLWVSPDRRGHGLGPRFNRHISHEYSRTGMQRVVSTVDALNRNSLRADAKVGYERLGRILILRVFGFGGVFSRRMKRLGWWTRRRPLVLPIGDVERSLGRADNDTNAPAPI